MARTTFPLKDKEERIMKQTMKWACSVGLIFCLLVFMLACGKNQDSLPSATTGTQTTTESPDDRVTTAEDTETEPPSDETTPQQEPEPSPTDGMEPAEDTDGASYGEWVPYGNDTVG